ncbi:hypothetical protein BOTBODRAFT_648039 [Botryobasidium botryosum FD-172 SS1]|uniref:Cytochrome P450 n=1 Tax=Botryobasidium botryosum (strain FD-172 SS1) TaxID=930990 RepID=A0A067LWX0_BOTB1|nr:hypothetical protein BOTBODRAFT_648039 [Botryobasidium botryosum FD-172 SS1]
MLQLFDQPLQASAAFLALLSTVILCRRVLRVLLDYFTTDVCYVPKPTGAHWLWGHELEPSQRRPGEVYARWFDGHGSVVRISSAFKHDDILVVADPGILSHIFIKRPYAYPKSSLFRSMFLRLAGKGLIWAEGEDHKRMRSTLNGVFGPERLKDMYEDVKACSDRMTSALVNYVTSHGGDTVVQIPEWSTNVTLDVIGRVGFGHDFGCGETLEAKTLSKAWTEMVELNMSKAGKKAPIVLRAFPIINLLPIPALRAQGAINSIIRVLGERLFVKEEQDPKSVTGKDLLSTLSKLCSSNHDTTILKDELLDHVRRHMAGHETTAVTLSLMLLTLARNPAIQTKLRKELLEFPTEPTYDDFATKLPYLDAVIKEGIRMFPAGPSTERIAVEDDVVPLRQSIKTPGGKVLTSLRIRKGQIILVPTILINRDNAVWGDGWTFRPERWLESDGLPPPSETTQGWSQTLTFLQGPRMCIGHRLVILELKVLISSLIKTFVLHDTDAAIEHTFSVTLQTKPVGEEHVSLPLRLSLVQQ